jgi:GxxExxY protein
MKSEIKKLKDIATGVYKTLGSGHSESVYDEAMQIGLRLEKIKYESQRVVPLTYKDHHIGAEYLDLIARFGGKKIILELKAVGGSLGPAEEQQIKNYMKILRIKHGLLVNFQSPKKEGKSKIEFKEVEL